MRKAMIAPGRYIQGENELGNLGEFVKAYGNKALLVASKDDQARVQGLLDESVTKGKYELFYAGFNLECTKPEIERIRAIAKEKGADVIIGLGGGKSLDTAKAVGHHEKKPVILFPRSPLPMLLQVHLL
jgi:glycerol dehydrogenase